MTRDDTPRIPAIPAFPDAVRSDTYAVDYGRILGPEWVARWTRIYAADNQAEAIAAEAIRVAAVFVDPANAIHTDLFARPRPNAA